MKASSGGWGPRSLSWWVGKRSGKSGSDKMRGERSVLDTLRQALAELSRR